MAITTLEGMISGLQNPIDFVQGLTETMVAGRPVDLSLVPLAQQSWYGSSVINTTSPNNPSDGYTTLNMASATTIFSAGQEISVSGYGTHAVCGVHTIHSVPNDYSIVISTDTSTNAGSNGMVCSRDIRNSPGCGGTNGSLSSMSSYPGKLPFVNPASGNTYLARLEAQAGVAGTLLLCDRLWFTAGITSYLTHTEYFDNVAQIPARDMNGTNTGHGVLAAIVVLGTPYASSTSVGEATLTYTNQDGTTGKTSSLLIPATAGPPTGTFYLMNLAAGDTGIRQVESLAITSKFFNMFDWTDTGSLGLVLYRVLARLPLKRMHTMQAIDALTGGFPRLFDDTNPFLVFIPEATTSSYITGHVQYAQG